MMKRKIGLKIKHYRIQRNMTQSELAAGIISTSYLSKIENEKLFPPRHIVKLLSKRLDIELTSNHFEIEYELCREWFNYLLSGNKEKCILIFEDIKHLEFIANSHLTKLIEIHILQFYLLSNHKGLEKQYYLLQKNSKNYNDIENYYWFKFSGNYFSARLFYKEALNHYQLAEKHLNKYIFSHEEESNDLYFLISIIASKLRKDSIVLIYAKKSLLYYQHSYHLKKAAECNVLLGITYNRIGEFEKSMENYNFALTIAKEIKDNYILRLCYQNLGMLFSNYDNFNKSIEYYNKSYKLRNDESPRNKIVPVFSLVKLYYAKGDLKNATKWLAEGMGLINNLNESDSIYVYKLKVYNHLIKNEGGMMENLIISNVLPFLEKRKLNYEKIDFLKILADYYFKNKKYKSAAIYYREASATVSMLK